MYLDTDILLALVKKEDWLKRHVNISKIASPKTSSLNVIEARMVIQREYSKDKALKVSKEINKLKIEIISINKKIIDKSQDLLEKYDGLNNFDAVHAATAIIKNEMLISTDTIYNKIEEVNNIDPRKIS